MDTTKDDSLKWDILTCLFFSITMRMQWKDIRDSLHKKYIQYDLETFETIEIGVIEDVRALLKEGDQVEYWNIEDGSRIVTLNVHEDNPRNWDVTAMDLSNDGRYAVTGGYYGSINAASLWDLQTGEEIRRMKHEIWTVDFPA